MNPNNPVPNLNLPEPVDQPQQVTQDPVATDPHSMAQPVADKIQASAGAQAQDNFGDQLSPQWVHIIEQAVRQGIDDPRTLSLKLDELRSQYISGRFAKEVKRQSGDAP